MENATNDKISVVKRISLDIRIGDSRVRVVLGVERDLAVPVFLGTSFIDRFVKGFFSPEPKEVSYISRPVPILPIRDL